MASIDAFWDLAACEPPSKPVLRMSLLRCGQDATSKTDRRAAHERTLILTGIALLHALFMLVLLSAMRPMPRVHQRQDLPLQITFIERHATVDPVVPAPTTMSPPIPQPQTPHPLLSQRMTPRTDALQAVEMPPRPQSVDVTPQRASLYDATGALQVPAAAAPPPRRDLLAHRSAAWMLPGAARADSPDFHVRAERSPRDVINSAGGMVSGLLANGARVMRTDSDGVAPVVADRGVRTSGRDTDPCEDIALDMTDLADAKVREQAEERYEQSCEGH